MKVNAGQAPSTLIPEYIGSAFDAVLTCADNINDVKAVSTNITDVSTVADNILDVNTVATEVEDVTLVADNIDYVKDVAEGIEGLPVSGYTGDTPPTQPKEGATWYCTLDGRTYTWYEDDDSGQWVESSPQSTADDPHLAGNIFTLWKRSAAEAGYNLVAGSFEEGGVLTSPTDVLWHKGLDSIYSWVGTYPINGYVVLPNTNPVGNADYIPRTDAWLRGELAATGGAGLIGHGASTVAVELETLRETKAAIGASAILKLIPTDYPTLQSAVDALQNLYVMGNGVMVELRIESGHQPASGLLVQDGDFSKFIITSVDPIVTLSPSFVGVDTIDGPTANSSNGIITGVRARMPVLSCIIDANGKAKNGYFAFMASTGWLARPPSASGEAPALPPIAGVINCTYFNIRAREGSTIYAENTVGYGAGLNGYYANRASTIHCEFSDAHGCGQSAFIANRASRVVADSGNATGCKIGVQALRASTISAELADATGCKIGFFSSYGCTITASQSKADNAAVESGLTYSGSGYVAIRAGRLYAQDGSAKSCAGWGAFADDGGELELRGADVGLSVVGALARFGSRLSAQAIKASGCPSVAVDISGSTADVTSMVSAGSGIGLRVRFSSSANALNAVISGSTSYGVFADTSSTVNCYGASVKTSVTKDLRIQSGSFITATTMQTTNSTGATPVVGDTNASAFNTLTAQGAIFVN